MATQPLEMEELEELEEASLEPEYPRTQSLETEATAVMPSPKVLPEEPEEPEDPPPGEKPETAETAEIHLTE